MGLYLITFFLLVVGIIGISILIASRNREEDAYSDLETGEWDCPECGEIVPIDVEICPECEGGG